MTPGKPDDEGELGLPRVRRSRPVSYSAGSSEGDTASGLRIKDAEEV